MISWLSSSPNATLRPNVSSWVLDTSALLALLLREPGSEQVDEAVTAGAAIGAVNLSEVVAKLSERGLPEVSIHEALNSIEMEVVDFTAELAFRAGLLRQLTRQAGLSLGDRACLALAQTLQLPVLTADRAWQGLVANIAVRVIR